MHFNSSTDQKNAERLRRAESALAEAKDWLQQVERGALTDLDEHVSSALRATNDAKTQTRAAQTET